MMILVANLGSTSFKYRLFRMPEEEQLARGGVERIGAAESRCFVEIGGTRHERVATVADHAAALEQCLAQLTDPQHGCLENAAQVAAVGFKAVHGGRVGGVQRVTPEVLAAMEEMNDVAPAHNPPYVRAMRLLAERFPQLPLVAAFETGFHDSIPEPLRLYGVPYEWAEKYQVRRWGFHGASHRYIAGRSAQILGRNDARVISCHLGGSSSLCAIRAGRSLTTSMGMSPQTGLSHNNRAGDFDPFALPHLMRKTGLGLEKLLEQLASTSGLLGVSGLSGDVRDLEQAAGQGHARARLALEMFVAEVRRYLGAMLVELGGADLVAFTGGIGENSATIRQQVCRNLEELGIELDPQRNSQARGECRISHDRSRVAVWVVPTNEELVVARQTYQHLQGT
ncbi:MAG: acetate kinase [Pirellulaceae bacterium]|nr:MAG: acetate kinase [Pirellulaceae bacterium]